MARTWTRAARCRVLERRVKTAPHGRPRRPIIPSGRPRTTKAYIARASKFLPARQVRAAASWCRRPCPGSPPVACQDRPSLDKGSTLTSARTCQAELTTTRVSPLHAAQVPERHPTTLGQRHAREAAGFLGRPAPGSQHQLPAPGSQHQAPSTRLPVPGSTGKARRRRAGRLAGGREGAGTLLPRESIRATSSWPV